MQSPTDVQSARRARSLPLTRMPNDGDYCAGDCDSRRRRRHSEERLDDDFARIVGDAFPDDASAVASEVPSEASMNVLMRYMGCSARPYMNKSAMSPKKSPDDNDGDSGTQIPYKHGFREGDHVFRWKMLGFCYPIQVHGIVFSAGPDVVTIVDCGLAYDKGLDMVGSFDEPDEKIKKDSYSRMNILTLTDEKEMKKWTKIRYGEEVQLQVHSSNKKMQQQFEGSEDCSEKESSADVEESPAAGLVLEEVETCVGAKISKIAPSPEKSPEKNRRSSWFSWSGKRADGSVPAGAASPPATREKPQQPTPTLRLPKADPPALVLARLRFLLEFGEVPFPPESPADASDDDRRGRRRAHLLPPHHLLYANSECIAVFCQTGRWSTLQATVFLGSSALSNVKQSAALAVFLSAQTVVVPATGFWGFFGGTTTVSLFAAQPWLVPALVGGGMVYVGLPMVMLRKARGRWGDTERRLNEAFWSMYNTDVIVEMIRCWSNLE